MRRIVHGLLAALILVGPVSAKIYTNKTFLAPRSNGMNIAMEYTTWHKQMALIDNDKFGGTVQATAFYEKSDNKKDLGKYFGVCNWGNGSCTEDFVVVVPSWGSPISANQPKHLAAPYTFFSANVPGAGEPPYKLADKLTWRPYREAYGIRLDYHQKLDKVLKGLYFKVSVPIVHVKTSLGWSSSCCNTECATSCETSCATDCATGCDTGGCKTSYCVKQGVELSTGLIDDTEANEKSLADYLLGNVTNSDDDAKQVALCKMKLHCGDSETGIADLDFVLGYNFLYEATKHLSVNVALTIPTGNDPTSNYMWEAIVGNRGHWALGAGLDSKFQMWKKDDKMLDLLFAFNYRYLFSSKEMRTLGFKWPSDVPVGTGATGNKALYGHWWLGAKKGDTMVTPMANFLTKNLRVTPGHHFDGLLALAFHYTGWTFDLGYNLFWKEEENVKLKCDPCADTCEDSCETTCATGCATDCNFQCSDAWEDDTFAIPTAGVYSTSSEFDIAYTDAWINKEHLCTDPATNPSVITHKVFGGVGYEFTEWDYPLILGLGGSYEFATDNDSLEAWALWGKFGITF